MKTYTLTTEDDGQLKRAMLAENLAFILVEMDVQLRAVEKYSENEVESDSASSWRETLHDIAGDNGVCIGSLFE